METKIWPPTPPQEKKGHVFIYLVIYGGGGPILVFITITKSDRAEKQFIDNKMNCFFHFSLFVSVQVGSFFNTSTGVI